MDAILAAAKMFQPFAAGIPVLAVVFGGYTAVRLGKTVRDRERERGIFRALFKAADFRNSDNDRDAWVAIFDFGAMATVVSLIAFIGYNGSTLSAIALLGMATAMQGGISLMAFLRSRATISDRPENGCQPGERQVSRNQTGSRVVSSPTAEEDPMSRDQALTRQERARFVQLGVKRYNALRLEIEREHPGEYVAISVKTGRYTATLDDAKLKAFADSLGSDDFLWMTRVGSV
jgi:hypothetical protein